MGSCLSSNLRFADEGAHTGKEVRDLLRATLGDKTKIYLSDGAHVLLQKGALQAWLLTNGVKFYKYQAEYYDCDDFAKSLLGEFRIAYARSKPPMKGAPIFGLISGDLRALSK